MQCVFNVVCIVDSLGCTAARIHTYTCDAGLQSCSVYLATGVWVTYGTAKSCEILMFVCLPKDPKQCRDVTSSIVLTSVKLKDCTSMIEEVTPKGGL